MQNNKSKKYENLLAPTDFVMNEVVWMNEGTNERTNERMNERTNKPKNERMNEQTKQGSNEWTNEWMNVKVPLAAAISPYLISITHPTQAWNVR